MKIVLNHNCGIKEARGMPGDTVDAPEKLALELIRRGGAIAVAPPTEQVETTAVAPPENAARRTTAPPARGGKKE